MRGTLEHSFGVSPASDLPLMDQAADDVDLCKGHCNACIETQIKHAILIGVRDEETKQRLLEMKSEATLDDAITVCRSREAAESTTQELRPLQPARRAVSHIKKKCPASTSACRTCGKVGHFASRCQSSKKKLTLTLQGNVLLVSQDSRSIAKICAVETESRVGPASLTIRLVQSGGSSAYVDCIPDTGSDTTVRDVTLLESLGLTIDNLDTSTDFGLNNPDGLHMNCIVLGSLYASMTYGVVTIQVPPQEATCHQPGPPIPSQRFSLHPPRPPPLSASPGEAKQFFLREFSDVLITKEDFRRDRKLKVMCGPPMRIFVKDDAKPVHTPRVIPLAWQDDVKTELDSMCSVLPIPHQRLMLLNVVSTQRHGTFPHWMPYFDYGKIPLEEQDQHLTTFITPYGCFCFCRGPMGFAATGDEYCHRGDIALDGVQQYVKVVDDVLLWDENYASHLQHVQVLLRCCAHGITMNADKFVFTAPKVSFCGYILSGNGIAAEEEKDRAIAEFPKPANLTDLRSFMGLVNQLAEFTPAIAESAEVLRPLMSPKHAFIWTPDHDAAFSRVKKALSQPPILAHFEPTLKTILQTDASHLYGVGYALLKEHNPEEWRLVQCVSRFLADVETRYATIDWN
ncbi:uncharacterized protein LOC119595591 [Penaeus monodon]|uniref:uncharacterized protein LOC119595591 n=1 Tax=Penaeus monodon TaxID=6687 RepID=UPI0018A77CEC|nr:uncharacterized protein LOC119595591 [Penaeus monodon]